MAVGDMDATSWDERYSASELIWSAEANRWVVELVSPLSPGRALDLGAGEGRNAFWLVEHGWTVTAVDFSSVAVERMRTLARDRLGARADSLTAVVGDATAPQGADLDLVLLSYLHLPRDQWQQALAAAADACRPGGHLVVIGHARRNLTDGIGGPQDPGLLHDPEDVARQLADLPVQVERAELRRREVPTDDGVRQALDTVVVARRRA